MNTVRKCRIMPDGTNAVMVFLLHTIDDYTDEANVCFVSMNGWEHYDCEEIDQWPEPNVTPYWMMAEDEAVALVWRVIKQHLFGIGD